MQRHETIFDPWNFVLVLARKPGALRNGAPFKAWLLPANLERARRQLRGSNEGDRQMVAILSAVLTDGVKAVEAACAQALLVTLAAAVLRHRQARRCTDAALADRGQELLEPGPPSACAGSSKIIVNHSDVRPSQLASSLAQTILPALTLQAGTRKEGPSPERSVRCRLVDPQQRSQDARTMGGRDTQPQLLAPDSGHYEVASDRGADHWAVLGSLIETSKLNDIDPQAYLTDVLTRLVNLWPSTRIDELMPWTWNASRQLKQMAA